MPQDTLLTLFVGLLAGVLVALLFWRTKTRPTGFDPLVQEMHNLRQHIAERLEAQSGVSSRLFSEIQRELGHLKQSSQQLMMVGKDIASLQDILRAPKFRGGMGEYLLGDLLAQIIPKEHFELQHRFRNGEQVDALLHLKNFSISIDAKFPLENFKKITAVSDKAAAQKARREFLRDVKKHIDAIAAKYIQPDQGTADYALMYIPAENVYYEIIIKSGKQAIFEYALSKKVVPVSPNSFYAYLQAIVVGLQGMRIEKNAQQILGRINAVRHRLLEFEKDYRVVGSHLRRAQTGYVRSERKLERLQEGLGQLEPPEKPMIEGKNKTPITKDGS